MNRHLNTRAEDYIDYRVEDKVEARVLGLKMDKQDFTQDEVRNAVDAVKEQLTERTLHIDIKY